MRPCFALHDRFTPTCVGTTRSRPKSRPRRTVHPHVRGDDVWEVGLPAWRIGSPPRAWGRQPPIPAPRHVDRFTPTCVGTTRTSRPGPRSAPGSPPRAWGRRPPGGEAPARLPVHPHVRGDDSRYDRLLAGRVGSPPRAWGRRTSSHPPAPRRSVHPHVRGDDTDLARESVQAHGSPPRAWGRPTGRSRRERERRFTPTCVGTTRSSSRGPGRRAVHPHVRGDDTASFPGITESGSGRALRSLQPSGLCHPKA